MANVARTACCSITPDKGSDPYRSLLSCLAPVPPNSFLRAAHRREALYEEYTTPSQVTPPWMHGRQRLPSSGRPNPDRAKRYDTAATSAKATRAPATWIYPIGLGAEPTLRDRSETPGTTTEFAESPGRNSRPSRCGAPSVAGGRADINRHPTRRPLPAIIAGCVDAYREHVTTSAGLHLVHT